MSPHKQDPASREVDFEVEIDLSKILIPREEVELAEVKSGNAALDWTDWSLDAEDKGISVLGWANISFVLGSCLVALICLSTFDTSNMRDQGHIDRMTSSVRGRNLKRHDHSVSVWNVLPEPSQVAYSKQSPTPSTFVPFVDAQGTALPLSVVGVADRTSTSASSPLRSDTVAPERDSRTTASSAENASSNKQPSSEQSCRSALRRNARKPRITSRTNVLSGWQKFERSWNRGLRKVRAANSTSRTTRKTASSVKSTRRLGPKFRT